MNEIQNPPWPRVRAWVEDELKGLRQRLEKLDLNHDDTQAVRGEIRALKKLLELPETLAPRTAQNPFPGLPGGGES